jgi:hypothetical protein
MAKTSLRQLSDEELDNLLYEAKIRSLYQDTLYKFITKKCDDQFIKRDVLNYVKARRQTDS